MRMGRERRKKGDWKRNMMVICSKDDLEQGSYSQGELLTVLRNFTGRKAKNGNYQYSFLKY
ncbi:hypothetical protein PL18_13965 [Vibrio renipiscarius]|uniref:Uncharacterized protein n=1 Tax=Vibrio renipiscarius TaxID=1461322 RepID=A0A0C2NJ62_9VIBR|nr:hypothetical protein OJ16_16605 [Vibrio renipiscarius]KII78068.1 hypothetical protein PL18_13965 [Vibrio renipiscarius]